MKPTAIALLAVVLVLAAGCPVSAEGKGKKVLYIDSYHVEYEPGIPTREAVNEILGAAGMQVRYVYMDAKRRKSEDMLREAARDVKRVIEEWNPDAVIAADDAASKYVVMPFYKNADLPFVFIGVNWDATQYGFPCRNVTGQIEVELVNELIHELGNHARGPRIGFLAGRTLTDQKALEHYQKVLRIHFDKVELVDDFRAWQSAYATLQHDVDMLFFRNNAGIADWDDEAAHKMVLTRTEIPTGTVSTHLSSLVLINFSKVHHEFGEYAARTVLEILNGKSPAEMPVSRNQQAKIYLNMKLAKILGIKFPMALLENAHLVSAEQKKLFYINSYHKGYEWSDDIEKGLLKALHIAARPDGTFDTSQSEVEIRVFRMDTKLNKSEEFKKQAALSARAMIEEWQPDIVVASDDAAAKYLIAPYYRTSRIPFVFCGVNWDASDYGFPTPNITGMVEVAPVRETLALLRPYAHGNRIGFIGANTLSEVKNVENYSKMLGVSFADGRLVDEFSDWKKEYLRLQDSVDMLLIFTPVGIEGWNPDLAEDFILKNTKIPSAGTGDHHIRYALLGSVRIAEEQGWWAGKTAKRILDGTSPADIPVATNQQSRIYLNMALAKRLGIKFPMELIEKATFIKEAAPRE